MNFTLISEILAALPQIIALVQQIIAAGGTAAEAHNAVQGHPLIANAHPDIRAVMNTIVTHSINQMQAEKEAAAAAAQRQPDQEPPTEGGSDPVEPSPAAASPSEAPQHPLPSLK